MCRSMSYILLASARVKRLQTTVSYRNARLHYYLVFTYVFIFYFYLVLLGSYVVKDLGRQIKKSNSTSSSSAFKQTIKPLYHI